MITAPRQRRRRRAAAAAASLAIAVGLVTGVANPASAESEAEYTGPSAGETGHVHGTWDDNTRKLKAGLFDLVIDGEVESKGYCIDINTPITVGADLDEIDWATAEVDNLETVEAILRHYYPNGDGPDDYKLEGSDAQKAMATQAAIWHYTDGFDLTDGDDNDATVIENYKKILAAAEGLDGFGEPEVSLTITPPESTEGVAGELVGPYLVNTSADSASVTPSEGISLHDEAGEPFTGDVTDGTELWLSSAAAGEGSITATANAEVGAGRVFFTQGQQRIVLASTVTTEAGADAPVSFSEATTTTAPSTTTTVPETTTTVPITPETSVVTEPPTTTPEPTTTVPIVPASHTDGGLPVTGAQSLVLVGIALALVGAGVAFRFMSNRKGAEG